MKNKLAIILLLFISSSSMSQALSPGDMFPDISIPDVLNRPEKKIRLNSLKGKLVILEFWATWCSPCIQSMGDLEKYQKEFGNKLVVIAVSNENKERLNKFISNRPTDLLVLSDTSNMFQRYFPHRSIPHTVLIGTDSKVLAITNADNLSASILSNALKNLPVHLPLKKDNLEFDIDEYFKADSSKPESFKMLAAVEGAGSMQKIPIKGIFRDRRITIVNITMEGLFRLAFQKSYYLMFNEYDTVKKAYKDVEKFCVDAWIKQPDKQKLHVYLQQKLNEQFVDVEAILEKRLMKVLVIKTNAGSKNLLKPSSKINDQYSAGGSNFDGDGVTINSLADYMEGFGLYAGKVINETGIDGRYEIKFSWQPERPESLKEEFEKMGLYWQKEEREIEVLIIRKK
jgi:uncharacterized protein (TIGR03435 family)